MSNIYQENETNKNTCWFQFFDFWVCIILFNSVSNILGVLERWSVGSEKKKSNASMKYDCCCPGQHRYWNFLLKYWLVPHSSSEGQVEETFFWSSSYLMKAIITNSVSLFFSFVSKMSDSVWLTRERLHPQPLIFDALRALQQESSFK